METVVQTGNGSLWDFKGKIDYVDEWFLMGTPVPTVTIWLAYIIFVLKLGPAYMKGRPPFELRNIIVVYNIVQVILSAFIFYRGFSILWKNGFIGQVCLSDSKELQRNVLMNYHYYFLAKMSELLETVFFVLRKRYRQVSFLHVYHHTLTVMFTWFMIKLDPSEVSLFIGTINSFVHIIMYSYYSLSAFPRLHKYLWWKAYITRLQLIQFVLIFVKTILDHKYSRCNSTLILMGTIYFNLTMMIVLFSNFYIQSYFKNNGKQLNGVKNSEKVK